MPGMRRAALSVLVLLLAVGSATAQIARGRIEGKVSDTSGLPLPGVTVSLTHEARAPLVVHTDEVGHFVFDVPRGLYTLTVELSGFRTAVRPNLVAGPEPLKIDVVLELGGFQTETQVVAQAPRVFTTTEPTAPATIDKEIIKMAPVQGMRYDSALPLLPGTVRGPDGLISMSGARSWQGTVLVDHMRESDPFTGEPRVSLPITAIDTVQVYSPLPPAEVGPATGGVTLVNTKAGIDSYSFSLLSLVPRPRFSSGGTSGIESWQPTIGFSGPIVRGRVWLAQSIEYRYERFLSETVVGPQDSSVHGWSSFTRIDVKPRGPHHFTLRLLATPDRNRHYGLGAFQPADTVPDLHTTGTSIALIDRMALGENATLESHVHAKLQTLDLTSDETRPYVMAHERIYGSFFRTVHQQAKRYEVGTTWSRALVKWHGEHLVKAGILVAYTTGSGLEVSRPVDYVRTDESLSRRYEFSGPGSLDASLTESESFVQDDWTVRAGLKVNFGATWDANTAARGMAIGPRVVASYDLWPNSTKLTGGVGVFTDKPLLGPLVFAERQARLESLFDPSGQVLLSSRLFTNRLAGSLAIPRATIFSVQIDQSLRGGWMARAGFQQRLGRHEWTVNPAVLGPSSGELVLTGDGESSARSIETTTGFRSAHGAHQFYLSYVRSWTEGNLNDLNSVAGNRSPAQVLPDVSAPLAADVPHRLLAWGIISLPMRFTVSPFLEIRSGFPFTRIDENWNVVGTRNDSRFPGFISFDLAVEKAVQLPFGFPARLGIKVFNLAGRNNGRAIQRDVERPDFGQVYDPIGRQLRGTLEISWNK
jgi:Carboxypeptidase regulatory-like domain